MKTEPIFTIAVHGIENQEWQGELVLPDGAEYPFRSLLELLGEVEAKVGPEDKSIFPPSSAWK